MGCLGILAVLVIIVSLMEFFGGGDETSQKAESGAPATVTSSEPGAQPTQSEAAASKKLRLVGESIGFTSYKVLVNAMDKGAAGDPTIGDRLETSGKAFMLPEGTDVTQLSVRFTKNALHDAVKVRVLNGSHAGETLWLPTVAPLKDCSLPNVREAFPVCLNP